MVDGSISNLHPVESTLPNATSVQAEAQGRRLRTGEVLADEFQTIHRKALNVLAWDRQEAILRDLPNGGRDKDGQDRILEAQYRESVHALGKPGEAGQVALCLSGGGIRSAAFALGILQGMARRHLLSKVHYLSTVSGGGYVGCWLTAWAHRAACSAKAKPLTDSTDEDGVAASVFKSLEESLGSRPPFNPEEPEPIRRMRFGQKYLTPRAGVGSIDTWAAGVTVLRNLLLNWVVFIPLLAALLLLPRIVDSALTLWMFWSAPPVPDVLSTANGHQRADPVSSLAWLLWPFSSDLNLWEHYRRLPPVAAWADSLAALCGLSGFVMAMANRPSTGALDLTLRKFILWVLIPVAFGAFFLLVAACNWRSNATTPTTGELCYWVGLSAILFVAVSVGVAAKRLGVRRCAQAVTRVGNRKNLARAEALRLRDLGYEIVALGASGASLGLMGWVGNYLRANGRAGELHDLRDVATFGVPWFLASLLVSQIVYTALVSRASFGERDREWMARASGIFGALAVGWAVFFWLVLYGFHELSDRWTLLIGAAGLSGGLTLAGASSSITKATTAAVAVKEKLPLSAVVTAFAISFTLVGTILLAHGTARAIAWAAPAVNIEDTVLPTDARAALGAGPADVTATPGERGLERTAAEARAEVVSQVRQRFLAALLAAAAMVALSSAASWFINVNHFSLHALYRNRLVRTFLGASNVEPVLNEAPERNAFDGFSETDNIRMGALWRDPESGGIRREGPFLVVNMALNLLAAQSQSWRERKAAPFVSTPLHTGADAVGYRASASYASNLAVRQAKRESEPPHGLTLGTAMAISGAAVSPNWGYHSSPITSFLMMLANLRLGWWLGNPASNQTWMRDGPSSSWRLFIQEALGQTSDREPFVYLSDGGHFDNLGIYEMVRRRCRTIIVSDASADPDCTLEDLGRTLRSISMDLGVSIEFEPIELRKRSADPLLQGIYCAIGIIRYPERPDTPETGTIIYIKPGLYLDAPADVRAYAAANSKFPHDTTANQWFTESQFESYRALGSHVVRTICGANSERTEMTVEQFIECAKRYVTAFGKKAQAGGDQQPL